jgi:hypothetical protein
LSLNDLVKEEAQRQIDLAIEETPLTDQVEQSGRGVTKEEVRQATNEISSIIVERLPEIQQAILRAG